MPAAEPPRMYRSSGSHSAQTQRSLPGAIQAGTARSAGVTRFVARRPLLSAKSRGRYERGGDHRGRLPARRTSRRVQWDLLMVGFSGSVNAKIRCGGTESNSSRKCYPSEAADGRLTSLGCMACLPELAHLKELRQ